MSKDKTDELIESLSKDLKPVKPLAHPFVRTLPWLVGSVIVTVIAVALLGLRSDWMEKLNEPMFVFEIVMMIAIAVSALFSSIWLSVPDMRGQKWLVAVPLTLSLVFAAWMVIRGYGEHMHMPEISFHHCMKDGVVMGLIPAIAMFFLTKKGATTKPILMTIANALAVSAIAYIGLRFACRNDTVEHVAFTHMLPYVLIGIVAGFLARRLYKW